MNLLKKYPKFSCIIIIFLATYLFFSSSYSTRVNELIISSGHLGVIIAGVMYTLAFTSGPATAFFLIISKSSDILITGLIGGVGALIGDLLIFLSARTLLIDEVKRLSKEGFMIKLKKKAPVLFNKWLLIIVGLIIAGSPLSDEVGVFIIASGTKISTKRFAPLGYLMNTIGIFVILFTGYNV